MPSSIPRTEATSFARSALAALCATATSLALAQGCSSSGGSGSTDTPDAGAKATPGAIQPGTVGASIALLDGDQTLALASADQGEVTLVDTTSLLPTAHIPVSAEPRALLLSKTGTLLVTTHQGGELVEIDVTSRAVTRHVSLCAGAFGLSESPDGSFLAVACESEGTVLSVDPVTFASHAIATGLTRPRAVLAVADGALVANFTGGNVTRVSLDGTTLLASLVPGAAAYRPALTSMTANLATSMTAVGDHVWIAYELVNHDGNKSSEVVADDYGSVTDGNPKINPVVSDLTTATGLARNDATPALYAEFNGGSRAFSGPSALAAVDATHVLVAHVSSADVALLDLTATSPDSRVVGSAVVGAGPRGIAIDHTNGLAFVDNALDGSVSRLVLSSLTADHVPPDATRVLGLSSPYSPEALDGRRLFNDASNPHVTPAGVVSCATCHPEGGDDGLVWFVHTKTIPLKRRRTPNLANSKTATAPYHWDGEFPTMEALTTATITDLMAGDALLVDVASIRAFVDEIVMPPVAPDGDPAAIGRGAALFTSTGCATCHTAPDFTDTMLHAPLDPMSLTDDDVFTQADTPALHGLFLRAPYFHDGRAKDLNDMLTRPDASMHGSAASLDDAGRADLIAYLSSL